MAILNLQIYQELMSQGMPEHMSRYAARMFETKEQEYIFYEYLISIRNEDVTSTRAFMTALKIKQDNYVVNI